MRNHFIVCITSLLLGSCVSVQLPGGKTTPARDVTFNVPRSPFTEMDKGSFDKAWISQKTGNTISYLSECGGNNEPSLQQLETESLSSISELRTMQSQELTYNGRAAKESISQGKVDGVPVQIALLVFKKNGCNYTMSYGGIEKQFSSELKHFEEFKQNFKAP